MVGIVSYGGYVPFYRLSREQIDRAWGQRGGIKGEKAIANYDEDSLTMAVASGLDCLGGLDRDTVGGLFLATTTSPYREKMLASTAALALDLPKGIRTADFTDSLRAGTAALGAAIDTVKGGSAKSALVLAADCRLGKPSGQYEQLLGDGAASVLIGDSGVIATIVDSYSTYNEILDVWREKDDEFVRWWEDRFIMAYGYQGSISETVSALMKKAGLAPRDFAKVVLYAAHPRYHAALAKKLGFEPPQVQDPLITSVGNCGAAATLMMLAAALDEAKPGEKLLVASYGDGCDAYILQVTDEITRMKKRRGLKQYLESKAMLPSYEKYLAIRQLVPMEQNPFAQTMFVTAPNVWRERKANIAFYGSICKKCGAPQFPPQRICTKCQAKDKFEDYRFAEKKGTLFSFTYNYFDTVPDAPLAYALVNFEGGGRAFLEVTDRDIPKLELDMPVEMTFRRLHTPGAYHDYYWKCRPIRG